MIDEMLICPWCEASVRRGALVCRGCQSDVVYAATLREIARTFVIAACCFLIGEFLVVCGLMGRNADLTPMLYLSAGFYGAPTFALLVVIARVAHLRGKARFFRRGRRDF